MGDAMHMHMHISYAFDEPGHNVKYPCEASGHRTTPGSLMKQGNRCIHTVDLQRTVQGSYYVLRVRYIPYR